MMYVFEGGLKVFPGYCKIRFDYWESRRCFSHACVYSGVTDCFAWLLRCIGKVFMWMSGG